MEFEKDWLSIEKLEFKLLTLITVLADNHLAYRGTLADMCGFFGLAARDSRTNHKLKAAIESLVQKKMIYTIRDGRTWTLTLSRSAERKSKVIKIKREWVSAVQAIKGQGVDWTVVLKLWLYLIDNRQEVITSSEIAKTLDVSVSAVSRARGVLMNELNAIKCKVINKRTDSGGYCCLGTAIDVTAWIDK